MFPSTSRVCLCTFFISVMDLHYQIDYSEELTAEKKQALLFVHKI